MGELSSTDYEGVLDLVVEVARNGSADEAVPFSALEQLRRLIPTADTVAYWLGPPGRPDTPSLSPVSTSHGLPWRIDCSID